jgi:threonyl-tRNA synthetase
LPISDKYNDYARTVQAELARYDIRGIIDERTESIGRKIRDNELKKIPFLLIVGEKEQEAGAVGVRKQGEGDQGSMGLEAFREYFQGL